MSTVHARRKAMRATKRTCQECEARFYDLGRNPIVCAMCGADYTQSAEPAVPVAESAASNQQDGLASPAAQALAACAAGC